MLLLLASLARAQEEPDHEIHEALRAVMRQSVEAMDRGDVNALLPLLTDDFEGTSVTQEPITGREGVTAFFEEWFGPDKYMKSMSMALEADALTDLSADKTWGLVRGKGLEHYVANDGAEFDFVTRWTAVLVLGGDGQWRVRAVHFGTNHLDNPVLDRVSATLIRYGVIGSVVSLVLGAVGGFFVGRRRSAR